MTTSDQYARLNWHQRQTLNNRLRAETIKLRAEADQARRDRAAWIPEDTTPTWVATTIANAKKILDSLPPDPEAETHRAAIWQELRKAA